MCLRQSNPIITHNHFLASVEVISGQDLIYFIYHVNCQHYLPNFLTSCHYCIIISPTTPLHPFNGLFFRTTCVSKHQKGKPFWILMKQKMMGGSGISWTIWKLFAPYSRQITAIFPQHSLFTGRIPFLPPNWQHQSTEGTSTWFIQNLNNSHRISSTTSYVSTRSFSVDNTQQTSVITH